MNKVQKIYEAEGFVEVNYLPELRAIYIKWLELNEGSTVIQDAVNAAFAYATRHKVPNWIGDTSSAHGEMTDRDEAWASGAGFRDGMQKTGIKKFALIPPRQDSRQDVSWVADWEENMDVLFGGRIVAKLTEDFDEARSFLTCSDSTISN